MKTLAILLLSAASALGLVQTSDPHAMAWRTNVEAVGSFAHSPTVLSVNTLARMLKYNALWDDIYMINPAAGTNHIGSFVRLKVPAGTNVSEFNTNFVAADYVERGASRGITGNGTSKYTDTQINPTAVGATANSFSMWVWAHATNTVGTSRTLMGTQTSSGSAGLTAIAWFSSGSRIIATVAVNSSSEYNGVTAMQAGFIGGGTAGSSSQQLYQNGVASGSAVSRSGSLPNSRIYFNANHYVGQPINTPNNTALSLRIIAAGYTALEAWKLYVVCARYNAEMTQ